MEFLGQVSVATNTPGCKRVFPPHLGCITPRLGDGLWRDRRCFSFDHGFTPWLRLGRAWCSQHRVRLLRLVWRHQKCHRCNMSASHDGIKVAILPSQVRAARGLLGWSQDRLVENSGVPKRTLARFELEESTPQQRTLSAIRTALEAAGVIFIQQNGDGPGVRLRKDMEA